MWKHTIYAQKYKTNKAECSQSYSKASTCAFLLDVATLKVYTC
jgi:hypothetical protein